MNDWIDTTLSDVAEIIPGYAFKGDDFGKIGVPVIKIKDIIPPKVDFSNVEYVDIKKYKRKNIEKVRAFKNDFVVAMTGATIGKIGRVHSSQEAYINQRVAKICPKDFVCWDYIYYIVNTFNFYQHIQNNIDSNSAQENISATSIGRYSFQLPSLTEQRAIAAVLTTLDDKIDLLHRQNATLEAMAEALFRQWFVVEAKDDWEEGTLGDFVNCIKELYIPDSRDSISYVGLEHIDKKSINLYRYGESKDVVSGKYIFQKNDILFGKLRPYFHKVCFAPFSGVCSTDILVLRPKDEKFFPFCLFAFFQNDVVEYASLASSGTRMPRIDWKSLSEYEIKIPNYALIVKFCDIISEFIQKMLSNQQQIRTLEKLRDTLLPKLMSGEVRVRLDAEAPGPQRLPFP